MRAGEERAGDGIVARAMAVHARALLGALGPARADAASFAFDDPERVTWHYTPRRRNGVSLAEMGRRPAKAVHRLLATTLSPGGHARVAAVAGLEDVLDEIEGGRRERHAGDYWTAIFDEPGGDTWGWRFEGHHVSVNVTVVDGSVSTTPCFLGANPAVVCDGAGRAVLRPLAAEEDLADELLASLDRDQRARAVVGDSAPADILTGERPRTGPDLPAPAGIPGAELRPAQVVLLRALAATYVGRLARTLAGPRLAALDADLPALHFAWVGDPSTGLGSPHYYRLQGPGFFVELDNTQNHANHVHSVWRDPDGDFGAALLEAGGPGPARGPAPGR